MQQRAIGLVDEMLDPCEILLEPGEQRLVELARLDDVERIVGRLTILDDDDRIAELGHHLVEVGPGQRDADGAHPVRGDQLTIDRLPDKADLVIAFARAEQHLQLRERHRCRREHAILRILAQPRLQRGLLVLLGGQRFARQRQRGQILGRRRWQGFEPLDLGTGARDLAGARHCQAEQRRGFVIAFGKLAREHRLGLCDAGALEQLAGGEHPRGDRRIIVGARGELGKIGRQHLLHRGARARHGFALGDDLVIERDRGIGFAASRQECSKPSLGAEQPGRLRIVELVDVERLGEPCARACEIAARFLDQRALGRHFRAQPAGRTDPSVAHRDNAVDALLQCDQRLIALARQAKRGAAQQQRLPVQNLRALGSGQARIDTAQPLEPCILAVDLVGKHLGDLALRQSRFADHLGIDRYLPVEHLERFQRVALVDRIDRAEIADHPLGDAVAGRDQPVGAREQRTGGGEIAHVGQL